MNNLIKEVAFVLVAVIFAHPAIVFAYGGGGISGGFGGVPKNVGQVLGASTDTSCTMLLTSYMRMGMANDPEQVKALQTFLNTEVGANLPITGFFGPMTDQAVRTFQAKYKSEVLDPWVQFGLTDHTTGYVFKTTRWKINNIHCPGSEAMPQLP